MQKVFEALAKARALRDEAAALAKKELGPALQNFLAENPTLVGLTWRQYTPGFNDGDPCVFTLTDVEFLPLSVCAKEEVDLEDADAIEDMFDEEEAYTLWSLKNSVEEKEFVIPKETLEAAEQISDMISEASDILEEVFGNGAKITVTKHGLKNDEYDCGY